jgi:LmbE family N-acetylglucosaminyl deacetylase
MARHADRGDEVHVIYLADGVGARGADDDALRRRRDVAISACRELGASAPRFIGLPDNRMDSIDLLDVVQMLERALSELHPETIYTHHGGDLNIDHHVTYRAAMTACRPTPAQTVTTILTFEVPSSTDWSGSLQAVFRPNHFVDVEPFLHRKLRALDLYAEEMRPFPHSRSLEAVRALATWRGASVGLRAAEAFQIERQLIR